MKKKENEIRRKIFQIWVGWVRLTLSFKEGLLDCVQLVKTGWNKDISPHRKRIISY